MKYAAIAICLVAICIAPPLLNAFGLIHAPWLLVFLPALSVPIVFIVLAAVGMFLVGPRVPKSRQGQ